RTARRRARPLLGGALGGGGLPLRAPDAARGAKSVRTRDARVPAWTDRRRPQGRARRRRRDDRCRARRLPPVLPEGVRRAQRQPPARGAGGRVEDRQPGGPVRQAVVERELLDGGDLRLARTRRAPRGAPGRPRGTRTPPRDPRVRLV